MKSDRWQQIDQILQEALDRDARERAAFLETACAGDRSLLGEVESLIKAHDEARSFIEAPLFEDATKIFAERKDVSSKDRLIGPYKIIREIGHGGMGTVFLASRADDQYRKAVAIKLIRRGMDTDSILSRFRHERQILASLDHPNIARLLEGGTTEDGLPYFVMEYIEGQTIDQYCDAHRLVTADRLKLFRTVCSAVHYAHQNLIVHRDIKPTNILVTSEGAPKLLDFGIAKLLKPEMYAETIAPTETMVRPMTPDYASPEQVRGQPITTASDVYSLGVLLYELLTGHRPYRLSGSHLNEIERVICEQEPEKPSTAISRTVDISSSDVATKITLTPESVSKTRDGQPDRLRRKLAGDLDNIVLMAMRKEPLRRYASVEQFSEDIRRHLEGLPVIARKDTFGYRAEKFIQRHKAAVAAAAVIAALVIGFVVITIMQSARIGRERDRAERERDKAASVSTFLVDLFKVSDPSEAKGNVITAREILDKGADKVRQELRDQPEVQATLMDTIGRVYRSLGLYDRAAPLLEEALRLRRAQLGNDHPDVAATMKTIAGVLKDKGDYEASEKIFGEVLEMRRRQYGAEHADVAVALDDLSSVYYSEGKLDEAEKFNREGLAMQRKLFGNESVEVAHTLTNLAEVLLQRGDYVSPEPMFREALAIQRKLLGNEDASVGLTLNNLASLFYQRGDYPGAESLMREVLELDRKRLGAEHPTVAYSFNNLGATLKMQGNFEAAEPLEREALAIRRKALGPDHPLVALSLNNLAMTLRSEGDYGAAEPLFRESIAISRKRFGLDDRNVANPINGLAMMFHYKGDLAAAEPLYREALAMRRKVLSAGHDEIADSMVGLADLMNDKRDGKNAEPLVREALEMLRKKLPAGSWRIADAESVLGASLTAQRRFAEAEPLLVSSYPIIKEKRGEREPRARRALTRLAALYQAWGKPDKVALYRSTGR
jgi:eukaryotic-like serine/threonine-protein kinase